jgi:DNA-binding CsgD family transcriptional regulator/PAS domain-containing protein
LQEANIEYEKEWWQHDTRVLRIFSRKLKGGVCCEAELFSDDEVARDPLRQEFLRSWGIGAFAAQLVQPLPNFVVAFSVQRALACGHFEGRELATLELLGKHAARALLLSTHLAAARSVEGALAEALEHFQCGAIIVDRAMRILHANKAAEAMIGNGLSIRDGQLSASAPGEQAGFRRFLLGALAKGANGHEAEPMALSRPRGGKPLIVQAVPMSQRWADWRLPQGASALLLIVDPDAQGAPALEKALMLLGLTSSEARLAVRMGTGSSRREAADALGISIWTASDTIKRIYAKLDVSSQSALVRLLDRLASLTLPRRGD